MRFKVRDLMIDVLPEADAGQAALEQQDRALDESMQPQTIDEVDQLEEKLQAALEELRARRETLQKRSSE